MKSENDLYFDSLQRRLYNRLVYNYEKVVSRANDKEYAKFWQITLIMLGNFQNSNPFIQDVIKTFKHVYKLGQSIDLVLNKIPSLTKRHIELRDKELEANKKTTKHYKTFFDKLIDRPKLIVQSSSAGKYIWSGNILDEYDNRKILKILVSYFVTERFINEYAKMDIQNLDEKNLFERLFPDKQQNSIEEQVSTNERQQSKIIWKGNNQTEFVQLIYALYHSKLITNETNEITKLVEEASKVFNINLSKNWKSNFSKSKNNRNNDYEPKIFENLKGAYLEYVDKSIKK